jgi:hypothetical protein
MSGRSGRGSPSAAATHKLELEAPDQEIAQGLRVDTVKLFIAVLYHLDPRGGQRNRAYIGGLPHLVNANRTSSIKRNVTRKISLSARCRNIFSAFSPNNTAGAAGFCDITSVKIIRSEDETIERPELTRYLRTCPPCGTSISPTEVPTWEAQGFACAVCGRCLHTSVAILKIVIPLAVASSGALFFHLGFRGLTSILLALVGAVPLTVILIVPLTLIFPPSLQLVDRPKSKSLRTDGPDKKY